MPAYVFRGASLSRLCPVSHSQTLLVNKVYKVAVAVAAGRGPLALWSFLFPVLWSPVPLLPWSFGLPVLWSIYPWSFGKLSAHPLSVPQFVLEKNFSD